MSQLDVRYHVASLADVPAITRIYNAAVVAGGSSADMFEQTLEQRTQWLQSHQDPYAVFVIEARVPDGTWASIGFAAISVFYSRPGYDGVCDLAYYIDPQWQGHGIGTYTLEVLLDECSQRNMRKACGIIFADNKRSIALMEKFGFTQFGLMPCAAYDSKKVMHDMSYWYRDLR